MPGHSDSLILHCWSTAYVTCWSLKDHNHLLTWYRSRYPLHSLVFCYKNITLAQMGYSTDYTLHQIFSSDLLYIYILQCLWAPAVLFGAQKGLRAKLHIMLCLERALWLWASLCLKQEMVLSLPSISMCVYSKENQELALQTHLISPAARSVQTYLEWVICQEYSRWISALLYWVWLIAFRGGQDTMYLQLVLVTVKTWKFK